MLFCTSLNQENQFQSISPKFMALVTQHIHSWKLDNFKGSRKISDIVQISTKPSPHIEKVI